jgi:hypothetical protein
VVRRILRSEDRYKKLRKITLRSSIHKKVTVEIRVRDAERSGEEEEGQTA